MHWCVHKHYFELSRNVRIYSSEGRDRVAETWCVVSTHPKTWECLRKVVIYWVGDHGTLVCDTVGMCVQSTERRPLHRGRDEMWSVFAI
jgi:hypothetical protein